MNSPLHWHPAKRPQPSTLTGRFVRLEKLDPKRDTEDLWEVFQGPQADNKLWDYLAYGPFSEREDFDHLLDINAASSDPLFYSVIDLASGQTQGILSLMSIVPEQGRIEIGHIAFGAAMQRTPKGTEAIYLLGKLAFALGNRRLEWKCNNDNARSKRAALRFGFTFEGVFRKHMVIKDRNRDTAWFSITDDEWPAIAAGFERWLAEDNQRPEGQVRTLQACR